MKTLPAPKTDFIGLDGIANLSSGGQPPLLQAHREAFERFALDKAAGMSGYFTHWAVADRVREKLARLVSLAPDEIALLGNASEGIGRVISSVDWAPGDNVVTSEIDYASGRFALAQLAQRGVEPRLVPTRDWYIDPQAILDACDANTRLVYLSHVNAHTGQRIDLDALSGPLAERGILFLVDASHSLGVIPVDARKCDFLVSCTYKFLMGPHIGVLAWNKARWPRFEPVSAGRFSAKDTPDPGKYALLDSARRAEAGNVNHISVYMLEQSLDYLAQFSASELEAHVLHLGQQIWDGMNDLGCRIITPRAEGERGPNVCMLTKAPKALTELAAQQNILVWGDSHRLRTSLHAFSTRDDVARFLEWLPHGLKQVDGTEENALWL